MPAKGVLLNAVLTDDISEALSLTCAHMHQSTISVMEDDWIAISACIGKTFGLAFGGLWNSVNKEILALCAADELTVSQALLCTTRLSLLYKRCKQTTSPLLNIASLRSKVVKHFPEGASLSSAGAARYDRILPVNSGMSLSKLALQNTEDEEDTASQFQLDEFCRRILAGLSKLLIEHKYDDIRNSLEYLSKKKYQVPLLNRWPAPTDEEAQKGDMCWFLWGALACYYGEDVVATNLKLFSWNWRKTLKNDRMGLLLGFPYIMNTNVLSEWSYNENMIIEKITQSSKELWRQYNNTAAGNDSSDGEDDEHNTQLDRLFTSYIPRTSQHARSGASQSTPHFVQEPRFISYRGQSEPKKDKIQVSRTDSHAFTRIQPLTAYNASESMYNSGQSGMYNSGQGGMYNY